MAVKDEAQPARIFLGWKMPFPRAVAACLIGRWPEMDFTSVTVVVSSSRAGRRILTILADIAHERGLAMIPPDFVTIGELPERLYRPKAREAGTFLRQAAWMAALRAAEPDSLAALFPRLAEGGANLAAWQGAAAVLDRSNDELSGGALDFNAILQRAESSPGLGETGRWEAAARLQGGYFRVIDSMGLCDRHQARRQALAENRVRAPGPIVLAGVAELNRQTARLLERVAGSVHAIVFAPPELADAFDRFGCVKPDEWVSRSIDLDGTHLRVARTASEQAQAVFAELAEFSPAIQSDQVTIGAADESIVPHLQTTAENLENVPVRYGVGIPLPRTRPFQFLKVIADYLESGEFRHFSILIRHPDVERWLRSQGSTDDSTASRFRTVGSALADASSQTMDHRKASAKADPTTVRRATKAKSISTLAASTESDSPSGIGERDWKTLLDQYAGNYLLAKLGPEHRTPQGWRRHADDPGYAARSEPGHDDRPYLAWLYSKIEDLLGTLRGVETATADHWAEPILALLRRAYGGDWNMEDDRQRLIVLACTALREGLGEMRDAGQMVDRSSFPALPAHEAIACVLGLVSNRRVPPPSTGSEIEIVGWLELMPDDATHLIVTGFNEGNVPESLNVNPLINETVREALGLARDRDRLARDAYLLTAMIRSRPKNAVTLLTGRVSATGDPLLPSRLMFACEPEVMARRVLAAIEPPPRRPPLLLRFKSAARGGFGVGADIPKNLTAITSMRVTAFGDYLASPQGFYLKHVLQLNTLEETAPREMDPSQCGQIVHQVLRKFASTPAASSSSRQQCVDEFCSLLDGQVLEKFGGGLTGALKFQVEMIRKRLEILAVCQAQWYAQGWRIRETEWTPNSAALTVDSLDMGLRGRIDRIDYNDRLQKWAILDYKVANGAKTPERTHQSKGQWCDLQLPLYRHLARKLIGGEPVELGYVVVSDLGRATKFATARWDAKALQDADRAAEQVVRDVRQFKFQDVGENPPTQGVFAHIFGKGILMLDQDEELAASESEELS